MKACRAGHLCTVQFLISKRADVNRQTTNNDHTPLSLACAGGHLAVVELLLAQSADPFHKLKVSETFEDFEVYSYILYTATVYWSQMLGI
jgi:ankyrin repeat domain-containing protein 17